MISFVALVSVKDMAVCNLFGVVVETKTIDIYCSLDCAVQAGHRNTSPLLKTLTGEQNDKCTHPSQLSH